MMDLVALIEAQDQVRDRLARTVSAVCPGFCIGPDDVLNISIPKDGGFNVTVLLKSPDGVLTMHDVYLREDWYNLADDLVALGISVANWDRRRM